MIPNVTNQYYKLLIETSTQRVIEVFCIYPEKEFSLSDLAKESGVGKTHIGKILEKLYKMGYVEIEKLSKIWRIKSNQRSWIFLKIKIIYNLHLIYQSGLVEFLNEYFNKPKAIVLFGSFRSGEDISTSDIDIAIEEDEAEEYKSINIKELSVFENAIHRKIQIHSFNRKNVDINVFNNIANGIVLSGFLEVRI